MVSPWIKLKNWLDVQDPIITIALLFFAFAGAIFVVVYGGYYLRDEFLQLRPETVEVHEVIHLGSSNTYTAQTPESGNWSYMRTRDTEGNEFTIGMGRDAILKCQVGQTVAVIRQGTNARSSEEGCEKKSIPNEQ